MDTYARLEERNDFALMKDVSYGSTDAFYVLMDRYMEVVSRNSFRIMCDRDDSENVVLKVFVSFWDDVLDYDDRFTLEEWLLKKTCLYGRIRISRRRILRIFGVTTDVFVNASPKVDDQDDYITKQAWQLYCRAVSRMSVLQIFVFALCRIEKMSEDRVALIMGMSRSRVLSVLKRADEKVGMELKHYGKESEFEKYIGFLRKVSDSLSDTAKLRKEVMTRIKG